MSDEESLNPSVKYVYKTVGTTPALGGPMFILMYIQCAFFILNNMFDLSLELWQLVFPTFVVVMSFMLVLFNKLT